MKKIVSFTNVTFAGGYVEKVSYQLPEDIAAEIDTMSFSDGEYYIIEYARNCLEKQYWPPSTIEFESVTITLT